MEEFPHFRLTRSSGLPFGKTRLGFSQCVLRTAFLGCLVFVGLLLFRPAPTDAATGINQQINYQARLLNSQGATVPDGTYNIQFKIYKNGDGTAAGDTSGGGTLLWTENWQNSNSQPVTVTNGYLSVQLGAICALSGSTCQGNTNTGVDFNQSVLWLSVNIGGTSGGASPTYDGEMLPMRQLAAAPYALNSNMLGGLTATQFLQLAPNAVQTDSSTNSSIFVNKTGASGLLLELQSGGVDEATISKTGVLSLPASTGSLTINGTSVCDTAGGTGCIAKSGSGFYIHNYQTTPTLQTAAGFDIQGPSGQVTAIVEANGADILDLQNSSAVNVATFGSTGSVLHKTSTNATNAFQIQDSSANSVLTADTTNDRVGIGTNMPLNSLGVSPLQYNTGTASHSTTPITGSGTTWTSAMVGDQIVFANGVSETITAFGSTTSLTASVSQTVTSQAYKLYYPGLQVSSSGNVGIGQTSPSTLLDVAQNSAQTTAPMALLEQNGTGDATLKISNATNSNSFYLGQDASNGGSFRINSSTSSVTPTSPTAPALVQAANNASSAGAQTITKAFTTANVTAGNAIMVTFGWDFTGSITATGCSDALGNSYTIANVTVSDATSTQALGMCYATNVAGGTTDLVTVTFSNAATTFRTIIVQEYSGVAATNPVDAFTSQDVAVSNTNTDGITSGNINTTQNGDLIYGAVEDMNATPNTTISAGTGFSSIAAQASATVNILDENKSLATAGPTAATFTFSLAHRYAALVVAFRAANTALSDTYSNSLFTIGQGGSATFQTTQNSTTGFLLQNNNGIALLTGDTVNERLTVGPSAGDTIGALLVLGNKTNSGDPTGIAGAMYYNSNTGNFRCFQGGAWVNCIGSAIAATTSTAAATCTTACGAIATITSGWTANYCSAGHVFHLYASGVYSTTGIPTLAVGVYLGTNAALASDTLLGGGSNTLTTTSVTGLGWEFDGYIVCNSTTSVFIHGNFSLLTSTTTGATQVLKITAGSATTITNATQNVYIFPTWGTSSASNTITCNQVILQSL